MTNIQFIAKTVQTAAINIQNTVKLLEEDCTIPFISRYRKDTTGNLDEVQIEQIAKLFSFVTWDRRHWAQFQQTF